jgi:hypothetical protein
MYSDMQTICRFKHCSPECVSHEVFAVNPAAMIHIAAAVSITNALAQLFVQLIIQI